MMPPAVDAGESSSSSSGGGSSPGRKSTLPPPPTFPSSVGIARNDDRGRLPNPTPPRSGGLSFPLPPPPPPPLPPPSLSSGFASLPPPPTRPSSSSSYTPAATLSSATLVPLPPPPPQIIHSINERIPPLSSAPASRVGSGISLHSNAGLAKQQQQQQQQDAGPTMASYYPSSAVLPDIQTSQSYPPISVSSLQPPLPQPAAASTTMQTSPTSGSNNSWTSWAGTLTTNATPHIAGSVNTLLERAGQLATTAAPLANTLLENAGQLAYNTVETAADLVDNYNDRGLAAIAHGSGSSNSGRPKLEAVYNMLDGSPGAGGDNIPTSLTSPDNIANIFFQGQQQGMTTSATASLTTTTTSISSSRSYDDTGSDLVPANAPILQKLQTLSPTAQNNSSGNSTTTQRRKRALANPPSRILANRQYRLSVLILPTADAQSIAARNNTTLPDMFRVYGNLRPNCTYVGGNIARYGGGQMDSSLEPMLPPFRSASRSMALSWEHITLDFFSNQDIDEMSVSESIIENGLGEAVRLWDEDRTNDDDNNKTKDVEMDQLERYVVGALADDEAEERVRSQNGIASMSSITPTCRSGDSYAERPEGTFPPRPEEALEESCEAAYALTATPTAPWLLRFRHTLDCATDGMHHEMLRNPSVVILAASTSEHSFLNCLAELANVHHLPRPYHDGRYDPNGLRREFLLLHDVMYGPKDFDEARALSQMRERFGYGCCSILRVNSLVPRSVMISDGYASTDEDTDWENAGPLSPFVRDELSSDYKSTLGNAVEQQSNMIVRGACLSPTDKRAIRRYVANMVSTGLVPAVERRIAFLNAAVSNAKKGVKNAIKSFWKKPIVSGYSDNSTNGSAAVDNSSSPGSVRYRFDSIESQTRLLADTLFLMRDYDAALSTYRLVKDDYKNDKAYVHYASVHEMMMLCMHSLNESGLVHYSMDIHHSIETALDYYTRASDEEKESNANSGVRPGKASYATRLATRLCLVLSSTRSLCEGKHMEIANQLAASSSHETPLGAAVLLEQSAAHYYRAGMLRKFAFHMLMSGHMFRSAGHDRHAFRCFAASLYMYHSERWGELRSHLRSALAWQMYGMGRYALSMQFYVKLIRTIGGGGISARSQEKFFTNIINICKDHQQSAFLAIDRMNETSDAKAIGGNMTAYVEDALKMITGGIREIEIANIGFPQVLDTSIRVFAQSANESAVEKGDELIWQDMINCAEAELRASAVVSSATNESTINADLTNDDGVPVALTARSGDELIDKVIVEIDKEEHEAEIRERQKRKGNLRSPEVRSLSEPLTVTFSLKNPLGLDMELMDMQLVASLSCSESGLLHTNEFPISSANDSNDSSKSWKFHGSDREFRRPNFLCQFPIKSDGNLLVEAIPSTIIDSEPYFVVTKASAKLGTNSDTTISLNICPLAEGDLKILGVRFHLRGAVWVYHKFNLTGPLLQDTRENRSKRVRGESMICRSIVEGKMPCLKVVITSDQATPSTILQGQILSWKLKVSNVGYVPATNIMLKTNGPWLNMANAADKAVPLEAPTSFCVGPSGTLMKVPLSNSNQSDVLHPGESIEIPVTIRTSGVGRQDFHFLFRYEVWSDIPQPVCLHRWARKLVSVTVYPSITMSASLMPSYSKNGEHILSVELMNYRSENDRKLEIYLNRICIASRHFEVKQLQGQIETCDLSHVPGNIDSIPSLKIGWQERVSLHYLVVPIEVNNTSISFSTLSFSSGDKTVLQSQSNGAQVTDFMCLERAHEIFMSTLHNYRIEKEKMLANQEGQPRDIAQIRRAKLETTVSLLEGQSKEFGIVIQSKSHPTSLANLCPVNINDGGSSINIVCCWSAIIGSENAADSIVHGQHHLRSLLVRPIKSKGCPLSLTAKFKPNISHNFDEGPLIINLEIIIRNRLIEAGVDFEFAVDDQPEVTFAGFCSFSETLLGGDELTAPLQAHIFSAGVYNLQSVRLTVLSGGASVPYLFPLQWIIKVHDCRNKHDPTN